MASTLPGYNPDGTIANKPDMPPVISSNQLTSEQRAAIEAKWNDPIRIMAQVLEVLLREGKPAADSLLAWVRTHKDK